MMVFINGLWLRTKEIANNSNAGGFLQLPGIPIDKKLSDWLLMWYAEIYPPAIDNSNNIIPIRHVPVEDHYKVLPFAGGEFGIYNGCLMDQVASVTKMYLWRISFVEKIVQKRP